MPTEGQVASDKTLTDDEIEDYAKKYNLIQNFSRDSLRPASYDLRVGSTGILVSKERRSYIRFDSAPYELQPWETCIVQTFEEINMPTDMIGTVWVRVRFANRGLSLAGGGIDPGHMGFLYLSVRNDGAAPITLKFKEAIASVRFTCLHKQVADPRSQGRWTEIPAERLPPLPSTDLYNWTQVNEKLARIDEVMKELQEVKAIEERNESYLRLFIVATATGAIGGLAIAVLTYAIPYLGTQTQVAFSVVAGSAGAMVVAIGYGLLRRRRRGTVPHKSLT